MNQQRVAAADLAMVAVRISDENSKRCMRALEAERSSFDPTPSRENRSVALEAPR